MQAYVEGKVYINLEYNLDHLTFFIDFFVFYNIDIL